MAIKLFDAVTAVGVSRPVKINRQVEQHTVYAEFQSLAATKISAVTIKVQGSMFGTRPVAIPPAGVSGISMNDDVATGIISDPVIAIGSTAEEISHAAFNYRIADVNYSIAADASVATTFTAAHVIAASKWGVVNLYINAAGTILTRVPGSSQTGTQSYASAAAAHTAGDALTMPVGGVCYIGRILINTDGTTWTANTDDLTDGSDLTTATFISETSSFIDIATHTFSAAELTAQKALFHIVDKNVKYARLYLSTLTGTGEVNAWHTVGGIVGN
jgi:hypothetical protein